jgi:NAD(P)H-dependent flavin oxidoreductase YrpB (nitropropane dioxygenase family)
VNELCERLGIEFPIFAFTHCRDVAAAVSNAGGLGVLGAVGFDAAELETELTWLDEHVGDRPYGVDIVIPGKYEGMGELDPVKLEAELKAMVPEGHRTFTKTILAEHGVPELPPDARRRELLGWTAATAAPQIEVIMAHPKVALVANALGTPPDEVIAQVHGSGRLIAALAGSVKHARSHRDAGVDIVICQGSEGGGHTGDVGSIVLWPEVIDAVAPLPVLAAGGVGSGRQMAAAMVMGAAGVWTGSLWLTVEEADIPPEQMATYLAASSRDTALALVHRQAVPHAEERLDRGMGARRHARSPADAPPDDGRHRVRLAREPLPGPGQRRRFQPRRPGHRPGHPDATDEGRRRRHDDRVRRRHHPPPA